MSGNKHKEDEAWDMKFQNYWTSLRNFEVEQNEGGNDSEQIELKIKIYCERILQHVGKFKRECMRIYKGIVDEMHKPYSQGGINPVDAIENDYKAFASDEDFDNDFTKIYQIKNILFKVVPADMEGNLKWKAYKREFNSMDVFFDALYILSKEETQCQVRVPLS